MKIFGLSDIGMARKVNEDAMIMGYDIGDLNITIVADGMGGHQAGEIASSAAISYIINYIEKNYPKKLKKEEEIVDLLLEAMYFSNESVYKKAIMSKEYMGMGTTLSMTCFYKKTLIICHVGDSRIYRIKKKKIEALTEDHSLVVEMVKNGTITAEEAKTHPQKNVITRALGTSFDLKVDTILEDAERDDVYLLCSDGLTNLLEDDEILEIINENETQEAACEALIKKANESGGYDNITAILIEI